MTIFKGKRLLILGAGRGQIGLYKAAREMGVISIAGTMADNNPPCIPLADEVCYMNILDPDEVERNTRNLAFDGVATCCLDRGLTALGRLCDCRQLIGYPEGVARLCNDKSKMKALLYAEGVNTAAYITVKKADELREAVDRVGGYPLMIKATDLAGSRGIYKVESDAEALDCFNKAMSLTRKDYVIVEKFLAGREFGAQAFVYHGNVLFVMPHGDILYHADTDVPVGHYVPYECNSLLQQQITEQSRKAIRAIGLDNCAVNIDFIEVDGKVYVLELTGRIGANCLPELVGIHFGINYYKMVVAAALGVNPEEIWNKRGHGLCGVSKMIYSVEKEGVLDYIAYTGIQSDDICDMTFFVHSGSEVRRLNNSSNCLAQVVVSGTSVNDCLRRVDEVVSMIEIKLL